MERRIKARNFQLLIFPMLRIATVASLVAAVALPARSEPASFMRNGEPFFPIATWGGPWPGGERVYPDHLAEYTAAGFNEFEEWWTGSRANEPDYPAYYVTALDNAAAHDLAVILHIYAIAGYPKIACDPEDPDNCWQYVDKPWPERQAQLDTLLTGVKDHSALLSYETRDEAYWGALWPNCYLTQMKQYIEDPSRDPNHHIVANFVDIIVEGNPTCAQSEYCDTPLPVPLETCCIEGWQEWMSIASAFTMDIYPVGTGPGGGNKPLGSVSQGFARLRDEIVNDPSVPLGMILQGCAPTDWGGGGGTSRPTYAQTRFMAFDVITEAFDVITEGAKMIQWYGVNHLPNTSDPCWQGITTVAGQLSFLHDALAGGVSLSPGPLTYTVSPSSLHAICKEYEGNKILIVTNPSDNAAGVDAQITVSGWATAAQVMFEDEFITVISEIFPDHFDAWGVHLYQNIFVHVDMGTTDEVKGLKHIVDNVPDGDTEPASIGGREARKNVDPATDYYFYFDVSNIFANQGSQSDIYILLDYYDTDTGSLGLEYDADDGKLYKNGGSVTLDNDNQWERHVYHITDAYFGNRQNGGADFRIAKYGGGVFYLDRVEVWVESPLPAQASSPDPNDLGDDVSRTAELSWGPADKATSYDVYLGTSNPPAFRGNQPETTFDTGLMDALKCYYWRINSVNDYGTVTGQVWSFTTESYTGDFDLDLDVDQEDFGYLQACFSGDTRPYEVGCGDADLDTDDDVDLDDFSVFQLCMNGANNPPGPSCPE